MAQVRAATARPRREAGAGSGDVRWEEIARVAYELFERRGGAHGYDQQDWFEAEQLVRQRQRGK